MFVLSKKPIFAGLLAVVSIITGVEWIIYKCKSFMIADVIYYVTGIHSVDDAVYVMFYGMIFISMYVFPLLLSFIFLTLITKSLKSLLLPLAMGAAVYLSYAVSYVYASGMILAAVVTVLFCCIAPMVTAILTVKYIIKSKYALMIVCLAAMVIKTAVIFIIGRYAGYALYDLLSQLVMAVTFYGSYALIALGLNTTVS